MKTLYTHKAISDLQRLHEFIAEQNPSAAIEVSEKLQQAIKRLTDFPMLGREVTSVKKSISLRDLITGNYVIRYAIMNDEIHVLRIWHGKENQFFSI